MRCPACSSMLSTERAGGVEIDVCHGCGGVWLDRGELEELLACEKGAQAVAAPRLHISGPGYDTAGDGQRHMDKVEYRRCPRCGGWMARRNHRRVSGVVTDTCLKHGVWLDRGDYERLRDFELAEDSDERERRFEEMDRRHLRETRLHGDRFVRGTRSSGVRGAHGWLAADLILELFDQ